MIHANAVYNRRVLAYRSYCATTTALACAADPATGGNETLCHNWGNDAARAVWQRRNSQWNRIGKLYDASYAAAMHREHHHGFKPLWCAHCKAA